MANLTSTEFADYVRSRINITRTYPLDYYNAVYDMNVIENGTTHISVLALDDTAVAVTSSINNM